MTKTIKNTTSLVRFILIFVLASTINTNAQEIKVIDNKGTKKTFKNNQTKTSATAPSNPIDGDIWFDTNNTIKMRQDPNWVVLRKNNVEIYSGSLQGSKSVTLTNLTSDAIGIRIIYVSTYSGPTNRQMIYDIYKTGNIDKGYIQGAGISLDQTYLNEITYSFSQIEWSTKKFTHQFTGYLNGKTRGNARRNNNPRYVIKKIIMLLK